MKLQGNVNGSIYPVTQQSYEEPIDGSRVCGWCGHKFVPVGSGRHVYCSTSCRTEALKEQHRKASYSWFCKKHYHPAEPDDRCTFGKEKDE